MPDPHDWIWHGFWRLSKARPRVVTPSGALYPLAIEVSEKIVYTHGMGMADPWSLDEFLDVTEQMDDAYLSYVRAQIR